MLDILSCCIIINSGKKGGVPSLNVVGLKKGELAFL